MDVPEFLKLAEALTGTPVEDVTTTDQEFLAQVLADNARPIDGSQLNELLLLVNKDRMGPAFFDWFFGPECRVGTLRAGVEKVQRTAMLCFGNFIHAYRTLAPLRSEPEIRKELGEFGKTPHEALATFTKRSPKLLDVALIPRADTPLVGYLSAGEIIAESARAGLLRDALPAMEELPVLTWEGYEERVCAVAAVAEHRPLLTILANYRQRFPGAGVADFTLYLGVIIPQLRACSERLDQVRVTAARNQDVYLTWDHMDVYFATSMRKRWEYEDLFDFVKTLMAHPELADLRLRHFDPTQAYTDNRVNKGLVESLMLKRARCTVYSVQDTDTLGKDSELAATLAQGKPVIAYVPTINVGQRAQALADEDPVTIQDRLRFVIYADEYFASSLGTDDLEFLRTFQEMERFERARVWRSVPDPEVVAGLRQTHAASIDRVCRLIAASEARIYDRRARTLKESHPLAIQVNLDTGVANGLLVVRNVPDLARGSSWRC